MNDGGSPRRRQAPTGEWQCEGAHEYCYDELSAAQVPEPTPAGTQTDSKSSVPVGAWMTIIGSLVVGIGALLPWATESIGGVTVNRNAFQLGDHQSVTWVGPILIVFAVIGILIAGVRNSSPIIPQGMQRSAVVLGLVTIVVIFFNLPTAPSGLSPLVTFTVGFGVWLCAIGGALVFVGGIVLRSKHDPPASDERVGIEAIQAALMTPLGIVRHRPDLEEEAKRRREAKARDRVNDKQFQQMQRRFEQRLGRP